MEEAKTKLLKSVKKDNFPLDDDQEDEDALDVESQLKKEIEEWKNKKQKLVDDLEEINFKLTEKEEVLTSLRNERKPACEVKQAVSSEAEEVVTVHDSTPKRPQKTSDSLGSNYGAQALQYQKPNFNFPQNYPNLGAAESKPPPYTLISQHNHQYNLYGLGKLILTAY